MRGRMAAGRRALAAGSLENAAEEDSARPSVKAEAISVREVLLIVSYSFGMCCQSGQAAVEQAWRCGHAAVNRTVSWGNGSVWPATTRRIPCPFPQPELCHAPRPATGPDRLRPRRPRLPCAADPAHPGWRCTHRQFAARHICCDVHVRAMPQDVFDDPAVDAVVIANTERSTRRLQSRRWPRASTCWSTSRLRWMSLKPKRYWLRRRRIATVFQNRRFDADFLTLQALLAHWATWPSAMRISTVTGRRCAIAGASRTGPVVACGTTWVRTAGPDAGAVRLARGDRCGSCRAAPRRQRHRLFHAVLHSRHRAILHSGSLVAAQTPHFSVHGSKASTAWTQERSCAAVWHPVRQAGVSIRGMVSWCAAMPKTTCSARRWDNLPGDYRRLQRSSPRRCTATEKPRSARCRHCS